ncbi:MAG: thioredoxin [Rhodothermaceae bacterium]|nr:thioredoxin [Rhodothermaceae bacterium]
MKLLLLLTLTIGLTASACAQTAGTPSAPEESTEAEQAVQVRIAEDGVHVVHFWAPWCGNSIAELQSGWYEVIEANADVSFTFVTIWNDGETGQATLDRYAIPASVTVLAQPDYGPSDDRSNRRRTFLGHTLTWTPTTWIFRNNGTLAYAFNYGEVSPAMLQQAINDAHASWEHD